MPESKDRDGRQDRFSSIVRNAVSDRMNLTAFFPFHCVVCDSLAHTQVWRKKHCDFTGKLLEEKFADRMDERRELIAKRDAIKACYERKFDEHIKDAAQICGMKRRMGFGNLVPVEDVAGAVDSLLEDISDANIKRGCFIFYLTEGLCYSNLFQKNMACYFEESIMDHLNIEYESASAESEKGCIQVYGTRIWNTLIMTSKVTRKLKGKLRFKSKHRMVQQRFKSDSLFKIKRGPGVQEEVLVWIACRLYCTRVRSI
jgi:hypothetical protein